jgi:hypothetical protein
MSQQKPTRQDLEKAVIRKAITDETFRKELLSSPKSALQAALAEALPGATLPAGLEVKAFQEPVNSLYLVVPAIPPELSDAQLEQVAGGDDSISVQWTR